MNEEYEKYKIRTTKWLWQFSVLASILVAMVEGWLGYVFFHWDHTEGFQMLALLLPMFLLMLCCTYGIFRRIQKRVQVLIDAMEEVRNGNLEVQIPLEGAEEYAAVYQIFNTMATELRKTREEMSAFTNQFAHEFKTPIASIHGFAQYLLDSRETLSREELEQYLQTICDQSNRLLNLSQNTLLLSKMEAMQIVTEKETYDIADQIRQCLLLFLHELDQKEIELEMDEDLTLSYTGNRDLLEHIWINLISNAIKYMEPGGKLTIAGSRENGRLRILVADTGIGMDEPTCKRAFEKYYQNDTKSLTKGNGIGLAIVKRAVELSGGDVSVQSTLGEGSCFTIELP